MKIVFNSLNSGLGNNGGSQTIIKCVETIEQLGHQCNIVATVDNFTWFDHKPVISYIPLDTDIIVATACTTVENTLSSRIEKKAWYIRGHESWACNEDRLGKYYNAGLFNIVNSKNLKQKLASYGADSIVIYQGLDFNLWKDGELRSNNKIRIGCLYNKKSTKRWIDFIELARILGTEKYEYIGIGNNVRNDPFLTYFKSNASIKELNDIYSSCHIWFAPTELEGLHNIPMEAALCGCLIVCNDSTLNGMGFDYAFNDNTAMVYEARNIEHAADLIKHPNWAVIERMNNHLINNIGSREKNMKKLIELFKKL